MTLIRALNNRARILREEAYNDLSLGAAFGGFLSINKKDVQLLIADEFEAMARALTEAEFGPQK